MKYLKRFNESNSSIEEDIKNCVRDCFIDYLTDYSMDLLFCEGFFIPGYHFMTQRLLDGIKKQSDKFEKMERSKAIKIDLHNSGIGDGARLEIYLDENSQKLFNDCISNLQSELKLILKGFQLIDVPHKLQPEFFGINFYIIYEE